MRLIGRKSAPQVRDEVLGPLVREQAGVWRGEIAFLNRTIQLLVPGTKGEPDQVQLAHARSLLPNLAAKVDSAVEFVEQQQHIAREHLELAALNYFSAGAEFALDFSESGDHSGNNWHVYFRAGAPFGVDYS